MKKGGDLIPMKSDHIERGKKTLTFTVDGFTIDHLNALLEDNTFASASTAPPERKGGRWKFTPFSLSLEEIGGF